VEGAGLELVDLPLGAWTHDGGTLRTASAIDVRLIPSHQSAAPPGPTACKRAGRDVAPSLTGPLAGRRGLGHRGLARRQIRELVAAAWPAASEETPRRLNPASRFTEETSLTMGTGPKAPSHTLRESLPVLTLALSGRPQPRQFTPVRTTNGATPRSSRAYQRRRGLSARPGEGFAFDASEESRSSSAPWCRRRPALLEDDKGSLSQCQ
jgi:hypothetical protein